MTVEYATAMGGKSAIKLDCFGGGIPHKDTLLLGKTVALSEGRGERSLYVGKCKQSKKVRTAAVERDSDGKETNGYYVGCLTANEKEQLGL